MGLILDTSILIADERGLSGPTPRAAHACVNKWLTRRLLSAADVPVPRFALARSEKDVRRFAGGFPLIVKPVASTLGRLVLRVDSAEQIEEKVHALQSGLHASPDARRCAEFASLAGLDLECDPFRIGNVAQGPVESVARASERIDD